MSLTLSPELENWVNEKVASGLYASASEVVREALKLLQQRDELRRELTLGVEQLKRGEYQEYESVDELLTDIQTRGQARREAKRHS